MRCAASLIALLVIAGCQSGSPRLIETRTDGGADAGSSDAGPADSGFIDAGPPDAGPPDAGLTDAGPDAGPLDAGHDAGASCIPDASPAHFGAQTALTSITQTWMLAAADFNRDGIEDVLVVGWDPKYGGTGSSGASLYYGLSDGGLRPGPFLYDSSATYAATGDLNGDGWTDLVVTGDAIHVEMNQGDGSFARTEISTTFINYATLFADLDGDGRSDLVACSPSGIFIYFDDGGAPSFGAPVAVAPPPWAESDAGAADFCNSLALTDLNSDGNADLSSIESSANLGVVLVVRLGLGDGGFSTATSYPTSASRLVVQDLNDDGLPDVIGPNGTGLAVRLNLGGGVLGPEVDVVTESQTLWSGLLTVADLNGDGLPDIATAGGPGCDSASGGGASVFLGDGCGGFTVGTPLATNPSVVINGISAWRPADARLPSLLVGDLCDGNVSIFPNVTPDAG